MTMMAISAKRAALLFAAGSMILGLAATTASAEVGQHRIIPGVPANAAHPAHAARNAPDLYCEKQQNKCQ